MNRRSFLHATLGAGALAAGTAPTARAASPVNPALAQAIAALPKKCLTPQGEFRNVERGNPLPYKLPLEKRRAVGLERETWQLEVFGDPEDDATPPRPAKLENPMTRAGGNAFTFADLMKLAETKAVRYLKVVSCNNIFAPLGLGLWEGVPLRDVLWRARPVENIRHVFYDGYHNDDPKQLFQCWLPANRVFEDPPGELPVLLCYKINGEWLTGERGGPVRMIVPEAYGFKSVKWLQRVVLTNNHQPNDTYANGNNDINSSWLKTWARFLHTPSTVKAGAAFAITGQAQVGISGLAKVQYWLHPQGAPLPKDDEHFATAPWRDAEILPLPDNWAEGLGPGMLSDVQFNPATGQPRQWPMRYTWCHWAALLSGAKPGKYDLRCRTVDLAGHGQPMPRPFPKSGRNAIQSVSVEVTA